MHQALYRTERPQIFENVIGQDNIVKVLKHQINTGTVNHAYLFCGTRGTGKTTVARLLAKGVNCLGDSKPCGICENCKKIEEGRMLDVVEFDAASHRSINDIRDIQESINYPPTEGHKKVYIIDEAHMLTKEASNGILKILEEPPEYVIFVLATTEPQSILQTIKSRCIQLDFKRVSKGEIAKQMNSIALEKGVSISSEGLGLLASSADGSVRDGLSLLDQCLASGEKELSREHVLDFLGLASDDFFMNLTNSVLDKNPGKAIVLLDKILSDGKDVKQVMSGWLEHYRGLLISKFVENPENIISMSKESSELLKNQSEKMSLDELNKGILEISKSVEKSKKSSQPRILLEMTIVNLSTMGFNEERSGNIDKRVVADFTKTDPELDEKKSEVDSVSVQSETIERINRDEEEENSNKLEHIDFEFQGASNLEFASDDEEFFDFPDDLIDKVVEAEKDSVKEADVEILARTNIDFEEKNDTDIDLEKLRAEIAQAQFDDLDDDFEDDQDDGFEDDRDDGFEESVEIEVASLESVITDKEYLQEIWDDLFDVLDSKDNASFQLVKFGANLAEVGNSQFKIIVNSRFYDERLQKRRAEVTNYMSERFGRKLSMVVVNQNPTKGNSEESENADVVHKVKQNVKNKLGIDITIK